MANFSRFTETYTSFSGADIVATFSGTVVGTLSGITWSITREKAPIYTMGSPNPRSFSRGKRGIAGSMIFTTFDRPALYQMIVDHVDDDSLKIFQRVANMTPGFGNTQHRGITPVNPTTAESGDYTNVEQFYPYYSDQIPPFDIAITMANEYGQSAVKSIYGVEILNEGSGASMDDVVIEETMTFVARDVGPLLRTKINQGAEKDDFDPGSGGLSVDIFQP